MAFKMNGWSAFTKASAFKQDDEDENVYKLGLTALGEDPKDVHIEKLKQKAIDHPWGYKAKRRKYHHFYDDGECVGCTIQELEGKKKKK